MSITAAISRDELLQRCLRTLEQYFSYQRNCLVLETLKARKDIEQAAQKAVAKTWDMPRIRELGPTFHLAINTKQQLEQNPDITQFFVPLDELSLLVPPNGTLRQLQEVTAELGAFSPAQIAEATPLVDRAAQERNERLLGR